LRVIVLPFSTWRLIPEPFRFGQSRPLLEDTTVILRTFIVASIVTACVATAFPQPQLSLSTTDVTPGERVTVTVAGTPGEFYAVIGSTVNRGFAYSGVAFGVGNDVPRGKEWRSCVRRVSAFAICAAP
jgi:hypothetical protein